MSFFGLKKYHFVKFWKIDLQKHISSRFWDKNFQIYVSFLLLNQFKSHLRGKESKHNTFEPPAKKRAKRVPKRVNLDFGQMVKIWILRFSPFDQNLDLPFLVPFLPFFCRGFKSIVFGLLASQMVFKLVQNHKRDIDLKIFVSKSGRNVLLDVNFSKFHKMVLFETEKGHFSPKNWVAIENELCY